MATNRDYTADFQNNVKVSLEAENIAKDLLGQLIPNTKFTSVRDDAAYYHIGDLLGNDGKGYDVKDDGIIHRTGNVFCEELKIWKSGIITDGWMRNGQYDYLCILDQIDHHFYVLDFPKLKRVYKNGKDITTDMGDNDTFGYIYPLRKCREQRILLFETEYYYEEIMNYNYIK